MSDKCPNCGSESRDFRGITGMFGTICSDEWHDKATVLDDKDKHIAELEAMIVRLHNTHPQDIAGMLDWWTDMFKLMPIKSEGGAGILDERYFCVCGEPVYAGEISCLKCGTPRPAYTRHPSKSEGGADER